MRHSVIAAVLLAATSTANAGLSFQELSTATRTEAFNVTDLPLFAVGTTLKLGTLVTDGPGTVTFAYLGQESGFIDKFFLTIGATQHLFESDLIGKSISALVGSPGPVSFMFEGDTGKYAINGGLWDTGTSIGLIGTNMLVSRGGGAGTYDFVLGYNDSAGAAKLGDWDDFVVGVKFVAHVTAVPEPGIYAMMGVGLALLGWVGRRRKLQASA